MWTGLRWTAAIIWIKIQLKMLNVHPMGPSLSSTAAAAAAVYRSVHLAMGCLWTRIKTPELPSRHDRWPLYANKNSWDSLRNLSTILCRACIYQCRPINFNNAADNLVDTTSSAAPEHCPLGKAKSGLKNNRSRSSNGAPMTTIRWLAPMAIQYRFDWGSEWE